jgi:hypothetical protein
MQGINEDDIANSVDAADAKNDVDVSDELALKESQSGTVEDTVESYPDVTDEAASGSCDESNASESSPQLNAESNEESQTDDENNTRIIEEDTLADEHTLNTNERTISTYDPTVSTCNDEDSIDDDDDASDYDDESDCTEEEGTEITDIIPLSEMEMNKWKEWDSKDSGCVLSPRSKRSLQEEQARAYEKLLFYAYTALTVPLPSEVIEKSEELDSSGTLFPPVLSPRGAELRCEAMKLLLARLGDSGMEVLKLNRERKWQPRVLTITKEVAWFKKSDDIRYNKIDCCPQGLLWVKKFNGHTHEHSMETIGRNGKGGIMFAAIKSVSVTSDHFALSKKQKKGKFKDSFTFVLHADFNGTKRDILFRCCNKDDICTLSSGFQAIIDRIKNETCVVPKPLQCQHDKLPMTEDQVTSPVAVAKPFSPKNDGSDDKWEV